MHGGVVRRLLGFSFLIFSLNAAAQDAPADDTPAAGPAPLGLTLRFNPLGLINKVRGQAEVGLGRQFGLGLVGSYYYLGDVTGPKLEPYLRFYTSPKRFGHGFYVQGKVSFGRFTSTFNYDRTATVYRPDGFLESITAEYELPITRRFDAVGGGAGVGYQFRAGRAHRVVIDVYAGLQYTPLPRTVGSYSETVREPSGRRTVTEWDAFDADVQWYLIGPGSVFNGMASIGYTLGGGNHLAAHREWKRRPAPAEPDAAGIRKASLTRPASATPRW
ncbi:hypothetical protein F0P96_20130 [Hymenobacter busanensis]|uniref:Uncharacterized protein n=1 Tax=Hymenobacter busanensis TaxID=2607656 RepID=A0A7L4ZW60_9BACT|nr:hypothetical protein [Hymenobacter busanensis]KAA9325313.1 hypothetical protein F0P96_20130 [Hymenobacter busanensis]QHJ07694.1 hypothetical protein GUY19_10510 [Hymenobacter busanensis]